MSKSLRGVVRWYHALKRIGSLVTDDDNKEIFLHADDCEGFVPEIGMAVEFQFGTDVKGRSKAMRIKQVVRRG